MFIISSDDLYTPHLGQDTEAVAVLLVASGANSGDVAADLGGEEGAHRVPQTPGHTHPVSADLLNSETISIYDEHLYMPEWMAEVLQCVPAIGAKLAIEKHVCEVKLEAEEKMIGHLTLKRNLGFTL